MSTQPRTAAASAGTHDGFQAALPPLRWQTLKLTQPGLGAHAAAWDELLRRLWGNHPMLSSAFIDTLLRHFGTGLERLCIGRDADGTVQAMAVLVPAGRGVWQTFMPSQLQIAPVLMRDAAQLLRALPLSCWRLELLNHDSRMGRFLPGPPRRPGTQWHALTTFIDLQGSFEDYLRQRPKNLRSNLRRYETRLKKHGNAQFLTIDDPAELPAAVARYADIESRGWKGRAGTAVHDSNGQRTFYSDLMVALARHGSAEVHELHVDGQLIASRLVAADDALVVILKTTYLEAYADCSPGNLLLARVVERAFDCHAGKRIEFCTNANPDQQAWATGTQDIVNVEHHRWGWLDSGIGWARNVLGWRRSLRAAPLPAERRVQCLAAGDEMPQDVARLLLQPEADPAKARQLYVLHAAEQAVAVLPVTGTVDAATAGPVLLPPLLGYRIEGAALAPLVRAAMAPAAAGVRSLPMEPGSRGFSALRNACRAAGLFVFEHPVNAAAPGDCGTRPRWYLMAYDPGTAAGRRALLREVLGRAAAVTPHDPGATAATAAAPEGALRSDAAHAVREGARR